MQVKKTNKQKTRQTENNDMTKIPNMKNVSVTITLSATSAKYSSQKQPL